MAHTLFLSGWFVNICLQCRILWFIAWSTVQDDEESQRKGVVVVLNWLGPGKSQLFSMEGLRMMKQTTKALPYRLAAGHIFFDNPILRPVALLFIKCAPRESRVRTRVHICSK